MCKKAGIDGYKTNHSLRATAATRLYQSGVDEQLVMERTGHRSIEGIRSYKRTSDTQREALSDILNKNSNKKICVSNSCAAQALPSTCSSDNTGLNLSPAPVPASSLSVPQAPVKNTAIINSTSNCLPSAFNFNTCSTVNITINNTTK
jgi:hypothetical protein